MANLEQDREESVGSQKENQFVNLERRRDRHHTSSVMVEFYHIEHIERSPSRTRSHVLHDQEARKLQLEIDLLRRRLWLNKHDMRSSSTPSSGGLMGSRDRSYRYRSRTPSGESFSVSSCQDKLEKGKYKRR